MAEEADATNGGPVLTQCECRWKKKRVQVTLTVSKISITEMPKESVCTDIRVVDIVSANKGEPVGGGQNQQSLHMVCVTQQKNLQLKQCNITLTGDSDESISKLYDQLQNILSQVKHRPRKLLVVINPRSGSSRGVSAYQHTVEPIFRSAGIQTDVVVTERPHYAEEILSVYDLASIQGIVAVGGDGIYHEVVNSLMKRKMSELGRNLDDPREELPDLDVPIGLIPCGTGNGIAYSCYGSYDVVTAALSIALGFKTKHNVLPVFCGGKLLAYSALLVGYGIWGDLIHATESRRNQGIWRYPVAIFDTLILQKHRQMNLTVHWQGNTQESSVEQVTKENVIGSIAFSPGNFSADFCSQTVEPSDTFVYTYLSKPTGRMKFFSFMYNLMRHDFEKIRGRDFIVLLAGTEWTVKLDEPSTTDTELSTLEHIINIDGEPKTLSSPEFHYRVCCKKIKLFCNLPFATGREMKNTT